MDATEAGDDAAARVIIVIHSPSGQRTEFQKGSTWVKQRPHTVPNQHLPPTAVKLGRIRIAAFSYRAQAICELGSQRHHMLQVILEIRCMCLDIRL